jgi:hypothetical protein
VAPRTSCRSALQWIAVISLSLYAMFAPLRFHLRTLGSVSAALEDLAGKQIVSHPSFPLAAAGRTFPTNLPRNTKALTWTRLAHHPGEEDTPREGTLLPYNGGRAALLSVAPPP